MAVATKGSPTFSEDTSATSNKVPLRSLSSQTHLKQRRARSQLSCAPCRTGKLRCNRSHLACDQCIKRSRESTCIYVPPPEKNKPAQNVKGRIRQLEDLVVNLMNQNQRPQPQGQLSSSETRSESNGQNGMIDESRTGSYSQPTPPSDNDISPTSVELSQRDSPEDVDAMSTPLGQMKISKNEISYVGESHWGAILDSISDLKRDLGDHDGDEDAEEGDQPPEQTMNSWGSVPMGGVQPHASTGLGFMLGAEHSKVTREQLISSVPEKRKADRLLSLWFNSPDPFKGVIHAPTFQDEYKRFCKNPKETPTMWIGLLYAIMSLAASFRLRDSDPSSPETQAVLADVNKYHSLSASAAVLADFTKPKQYTLECLILYAAGLRSNNAFVNVWLMVGLCVRLALRMGYHRDPSHYPAISPFHGEMRRRVWACIGMIDVLISFQLGLPSMFRNITSDTQPPRNILDRDIGVHSKTLPPSRGIGELTPSSYVRAKMSIIRVFADAAEFSHQTVVPSYEEILRLDQRLEEAKAGIPPLLQMPDISELVTDPAEQLMCRFNIDLLYLKTKIVLHRRYMLVPLDQLSLAEQQRGIGESRRACIESALRVLNHHHTIYAASQTGGQLESVKWYMGSISTHDFLLAAMIICLELSEQIHNRSFRFSPTGMQCPRRRAMMDALEKSQKIWDDASARKSNKSNKHLSMIAADNVENGEHLFDETEKASRAMGVMLDKVKRQMAETPLPTTQTMPVSVDTGTALAPTHIAGGYRWYNNPVSFESTPFSGMVAQHEWAGMEGVPDTVGDNAGTGTSNGSVNDAMNDASNLMTNGDTSIAAQTSYHQQNLNVQEQSDFLMTSNMLDGPLDIDWESWDNEITKGPELSMDDWTDINMTDNFQLPIGGNVIYPGGTDTLPNSLGGMDFDPALLESVDYPINQLTSWSPPEAMNGNGQAQQGAFT